MLERCFTRELWAEVGVTLVELEPNGAVLPARAGYDPAADDFGIGVNPLNYQGSLWYALPDVIAAILLSPPGAGSLRVLRALRLVPVGVQPGLTQVRLRDGELIDPAVDDPFVRMIEARQRILRDPSFEDEERGRLERFLKITANATSYGVLARFDRRERDKPVELTVYGPDDQPTSADSERRRTPGRSASRRSPPRSLPAPA